MKGLIVFVFKNASFGDCTIGGVTSKYDSFILVDDALPKIHQSTDKTPALKLVRRDLGRSNCYEGKYIHAVPVDADGNPRLGGCFGGNFIYTSDARFPAISPIPVHDRFEQ